LGSSIKDGLHTASLNSVIQIIFHARFPSNEEISSTGAQPTSALFAYHRSSGINHTVDAKSVERDEWSAPFGIGEGFRQAPDRVRRSRPSRP
jgi:hypothetical protein